MSAEIASTSLLDHVADNARPGNGWGTDRHLAVAIDQQDLVKSHRLPRLGLETLDFECVARCDAILFAACLQDCVHS